MTPDLTTTNELLGIMAAVSVLQVLAVVALCVAIVLALRRIRQAVEAVETHHVAPAASRVNDILDDVKVMTTAAREQTERVDRAVRWGVGAWQRHRESANGSARASDESGQHV